MLYPYNHVKTAITTSIAAVIILVVTAACTALGAVDDGVIDPAPVGSDLYAQGQTIYTTRCAVCHGANGEGQFPDAPLEPDVTGRYGAPPHDGTGHTWHHDDDLLIDYIHNGGWGDPKDFYPMPAFGEVLTDEEITAVIAYIKTLWTPEHLERQRQRTLDVRASNEQTPQP